MTAEDMFLQTGGLRYIKEDTETRASHIGRLPVPVDSPNMIPYVGKTSVGTMIRLMQHLESAERGSQTRFHSSLKGISCRRYRPHLVMVSSTHYSSEPAYKAEDERIQKTMASGAHLFNTALTGSFVARLAKQGVVCDRELAEETYAKMSSAALLKWDDPVYAEAVITSHSSRAHGDVIRHIRQLRSFGLGSYEIARNVDVDEARVNKIISGKTYSRILDNA
jgi:hypothetical protein